MRDFLTYVAETKCRPCCAECVYWDWRDFEEDGERCWVGYCVRRAPGAVIDTTVPEPTDGFAWSQWAMTAESHNCGEFVEAPLDLRRPDSDRSIFGEDER